MGGQVARYRFAVANLELHGDAGHYEVEDLCNVEAVRAVVFEMDEPPQMIPGWPMRAPPATLAFGPEDDGAVIRWRSGHGREPGLRFRWYRR
jgi:hypothetical protein